MSTGYRPPSTEPRGRWARHIHAFRKAHGWSQTRGFEETREGLGLSEKSRSAYIDLDIGIRPPKPAEEEALAAVYGWPTEDEPVPEPQSDSAAIVAAIDRLTAAVKDHQLMTARQIDALAAAVGVALGTPGDTPSETPAGLADRQAARQGVG